MEQLPPAGSILVAKLSCVGYIKNTDDHWFWVKDYDISVGDAVMFLGVHTYLRQVAYYSLQVLHKGNLVNTLTKVQSHVDYDGGLNWLPDLSRCFDVFTPKEINEI